MLSLSSSYHRVFFFHLALLFLFFVFIALLFSRLATLAPCLLSRLACYCVLLHIAITPYCPTIACHYPAIMLCCHCHAMMHHYLAIMPCYSTLLVARPCCLVIAPYYSPF